MGVFRSKYRIVTAEILDGQVTFTKLAAEAQFLAAGEKVKAGLRTLTGAAAKLTTGLGTCLAIAAFEVGTTTGKSITCETRMAGVAEIHIGDTGGTAVGAGVLTDVLWIAVGK